MKIIAVGHYSRVGKDTFANYLTEELNEYAPTLKVTKLNFAWKLKDIAHQLYAWAGVREPEYYDTPGGAIARDVILPALGMTPVQLWVKLGTPAIRDNVYDGTWVDWVLRGRECDVLIVPDVRFYNEIDAIRELGGTLIKVVRPGYGPRNTVADRMLLNYTGWDYVIGAAGTMTSLKTWAVQFARAIILDTTVVQTPEEKEEALRCEKLTTG